jgi:hypothetical protein
MPVWIGSIVLSSGRTMTVKEEIHGVNAVEAKAMIENKYDGKMTGLPGITSSDTRSSSIRTSSYSGSSSDSEAIGAAIDGLGELAVLTAKGVWNLGKFGVRKYKERKTAKELEKFEGFLKNPRRYTVDWTFSREVSSFPMDGASTIFLVDFLPSIPGLIDEILDDEEILEELSARDISYDNLLDCLDIANKLGAQLSDGLQSVLHINAENSGKIDIADVTGEELLNLLRIANESFEIHSGNNDLPEEQRESFAKMTKKLNRILNGITPKLKACNGNIAIQPPGIDSHQELLGSQIHTNNSGSTPIARGDKEDLGIEENLENSAVILEDIGSNSDCTICDAKSEALNEINEAFHRDEDPSRSQRNHKISATIEEDTSPKFSSISPSDEVNLTSIETPIAPDCLELSSFLAALELLKERTPSKSLSEVSLKKSGMRLFAYTLLDVSGNLIGNVNNAMIKSRLDRHKKAVMGGSMDKSLASKLSHEELVSIQKIIDFYQAKTEGSSFNENKSHSARHNNEYDLHHSIRTTALPLNPLIPANKFNINQNIDIVASFLAAVELSKDSSPSRSLNKVSLANSGFNLFAYVLRDANGIIIANVNSSMVKSRLERHRIAVSKGVLDHQLLPKLKSDELAHIEHILSAS